MTLADVMAELQTLRKDLVLLAKVVVDEGKLNRRSVQQWSQRVAKADLPGAMTNSVLGTSFMDPLFEIQKALAGEP